MKTRYVLMLGVLLAMLLVVAWSSADAGGVRIGIGIGVPFPGYRGYGYPYYYRPYPYPYPYAYYPYAYPYYGYPAYAASPGLRAAAAGPRLPVPPGYVQPGPGIHNRRRDIYRRRPRRIFTTVADVRASPRLRQAEQLSDAAASTVT